MNTQELDPRVFRLAQLEQRLAASAEAGREAFNARLNAARATQNCPRHGEDARELQYDLSWVQMELIYLCPACQREKQAATWRHCQDRAGIPHGLRHALLTNFATDRPHVVAPTDAYSTPAEFLLAAQAIDRQERRNLYLAGHTGIGKSHLAAALANHRLKRGHAVLWTPLS
jgi:DNA replication protein DnaC